MTKKPNRWWLGAASGVFGGMLASFGTHLVDAGLAEGSKLMSLGSNSSQDPAKLPSAPEQKSGSVGARS